MHEEKTKVKWEYNYIRWSLEGVQKTLDRCWEEWWELVTMVFVPKHRFSPSTDEDWVAFLKRQKKE